MGIGELVLVTGATGFLGHHLVPTLLEAGYRVRVFVRPTSTLGPLSQGEVEVATGHLEDSAAVDRAVRGAARVVHAGGLFRFWGEARRFERVNVEGTAYVMEACARHAVERVVHVSTIGVIGRAEPGAEIDEAHPCRPLDAYQRSKLDAENIVRMYATSARVPAVILRPGAYYGPWGRYAFNRLFFEDPLRGLRIQVHHGRRVTFPVFVPDVARACVAALREGRVGEVYNVSGTPLTHANVNGVVSRLAGVSPFRLNVPEGMMIALAQLMERHAGMTGREPHYPRNLASYVFNDWQVSSRKAEAELGLEATPFEAGAAATLEWYIRSGLLRGRAAAASRTLSAIQRSEAESES